MDELITLDSLILEGEEIKRNLVNGSSIYDSRCSYVSDSAKYQEWKNNAIRFLSKEFKGDRCNEDFENGIIGYENNEVLIMFEGCIAILKACKNFPEKIPSKGGKELNNNNSNPQVVNNVNLSQEQRQEQMQSISIFLDAIKDELTWKQQKELKAILENEKDIEKAKPKLVEKLISFGGNVLSNIVANIITNPIIKGGF